MQETIILEGVCNRIKGAIVENGHAMLTNQRFIYSKHSFAKMAVMGVLVNLTKGDYDFDIPVADIVSVTEAKRLFSKILVVQTKSEEYRFFFTKLEEWKIEFKNVMEGTAGAAPQAAAPAQPASVADELAKFKALLDSGAITEEEYNSQKSRLLGM